MQRTTMLCTLVASTALCSCAGMTFSDSEPSDSNGLAFYEPVPYLSVAVDKTCTPTATIVSIPGRKRYVIFSSSYGSVKHSLSFSNGIVTAVDQEGDTQIPQTISAIAGVASAVKATETASAVPAGATAASAQSAAIDCVPTTYIYAINYTGGSGMSISPDPALKSTAREAVNLAKKTAADLNQQYCSSTSGTWNSSTDSCAKPSPSTPAH